MMPAKDAVLHPDLAVGTLRQEVALFTRKRVTTVIHKAERVHCHFHYDEQARLLMNAQFKRSLKGLQ